jgi:DNA-binding NarL/FixJ family response regulator
LLVAKIGILEDDSLMRLALAESLRTAGHEVVIACSNSSEFLKQSIIRHFQLAILDVHLGAGLTGIDVAYKLRTIYPNLALLFLTSFSDPRLIPGGSRKLPEGSIYLEKSRIKSIELFNQEVSRALEGSVSGTGEAYSLSGLTDTQVEILRLVAKGLSNSQIAEKTSTTVKNVEGLISKIIRTLGLKSADNQNQRVHMARVYFRMRGVQLDD